MLLRVSLENKNLLRSRVLLLRCQSRIVVLLFILVDSSSSVGIRSGMSSVELPTICFDDIAGDGVTIKVLMCKLVSCEYLI